MELLNSVDFLFNRFFLFYVSALFFVYVFIAIYSALELRFYTKKNKHVDYKRMLSFDRLPSVSIIAPAYNEEKSIVDNIHCLLSIYYPNIELIIVNDGSKDNSMSIITEKFDLTKVDYAFDEKLKSARIRGIYKSQNIAYSNLIVIDKENGGKADALNAGINVSQNDLFLSVDVDCIIEPDAILKMVKPFLEETKNRVVVASGGVVRIANSCEVEAGRIVKVNYPTNFWARFQVLEYFRAFTLGRMAWSKVNGLLIISGAFGLFDRERVIKIGGYDTSTVGEDLELVVRLRRYMHEVEKTKYRVAFIPDPLCWTEVPVTYNILSRQRNRWTRGAIDTIKIHKKLFFNRKYGLVGMISFPYWVFFEWMGPIIQVIGLIYFTFLVIFRSINVPVFIILLLFVSTFSIMYSVAAIFYEAYTYDRYKEKSKKYLIYTFIFAILEMFIYQPLNMIFSLRGNYDYFIKKNKKGWGVMTRTGFDTKKKKI